MIRVHRTDRDTKVRVTAIDASSQATWTDLTDWEAAEVAVEILRTAGWDISRGASGNGSRTIHAYKRPPIQ